MVTDHRSKECLNFVKVLPCYCPVEKVYISKKDWICRGLFMPYDNSGASQHVYIFNFVNFSGKIQKDALNWSSLPLSLTLRRNSLKV